MTRLNATTEPTDLSTQAAKQAVDLFVLAHDESYRLLAYYAAIPLLLTPELLNYLRNRFLRGQVPWVAEVDLLLSDLCRPVDQELYAMPANVRAYLLREMRLNLGDAVLQTVARTLIHYVRHLARTNPFMTDSELQAQQWAAMVYLDDQHQNAAREIAQSFQSVAAQIEHAGHLAAVAAPRAELARLTRLTQTLAPELQQHQELIEYAAFISRLLSDDATSLTEHHHNYRTSIEGIDLRVPAAITRRNLPTGLQYLDFFITVDPASGNNYLVTVHSPAGEAQATTPFPFTGADLDKRLIELEEVPERGHHNLSTSTVEGVQSFGQQLFDFLLSDERLNIFRTCQRLVPDQAQSMRILLKVMPPELNRLPWEILYDSHRHGYVAFDTHLVRCLEFSTALAPLLLPPPVRILGLAVNPFDENPLNLAKEQQLIENALRPQIEQGLVELAWVRGQTFRDLQEWMRPDYGPWHIFHFIGNGGFDVKHNEGFIVLTDDSGQAQSITATQLGLILTLQRNTLRLVVLNTDKGAFGGNLSIAATLVSRGVPAVLAMQYSISDATALEFARIFYEALANDQQIITAVTEARNTLNRYVQEWYIPVFYMRSPATYLLKVEPNLLENDKPKVEIASVPPSITEQADDANAKKWPVILTKLCAILSSLYPDEANARRLAEDAEIDLSATSDGTSLSTQPEYMWRAILEQTEQLHKTSELLNQALWEYHDNSLFRSMVVDYYQHALHLFTQVSDEAGVATTLTNLATIHQNDNDIMEALNYYNQALPLHRKLSDKVREAATLTNLGHIYRKLGDMEQALLRYEHALSLQQQVGDQHSEALTLYNLGLVCNALGNHQQSLRYFMQALSLYQQMNDRIREATTLSALGDTYLALGDEQAALHHYNQVLPLQQQIKDIVGVAATLNNLGHLYAAQGDKDEALRYYEQALVLYQQEEDQTGQAVVLNNIGSVYADLANHREALRYFTLALPLIQQVDDKNQAAATLSNIALAYTAQWENAEALSYYEQALSFYKQTGNKIAEANILDNIGHIYSALGDHQRALAYYEQGSNLRYTIGDQGDEVATTHRVAITTTFVNLRRTPGYVGKPASDIVVQVPVNSKLIILSATPQQVDSLSWWSVTYTPVGQTPLVGWVSPQSPAGTALLQIVSEDDSEGNLTATFKNGDQVHTTTLVRIRHSPGYINKPATDILADLSAHKTALVIGGPQIVDGLTWWRLQLTDTKLEGWVVEKSAGGEILLDKLKVGDPVVTISLARLRQSPGFLNKPSSDVVADIPDGTSGRILTGPSQVDGLTWWQLETINRLNEPVTGWMAEGTVNGELILKIADGTNVTPTFLSNLAPGDFVTSVNAVRVLRTPGYLNKADSDLLGDFLTGATLNLLSGRQDVDGLLWWRVGGILSNGVEAIGWVSESAPNGSVLIAPPAKLVGTQIPDKNSKSYLALPFQGSFGISQLWGENPNIYSRFSYDSIPLRGHNGIDFMTPLDTPIIAVDNGTIAETVLDDLTGFGRYIKVAHSWGEAIYGHLNTIHVVPGQPIMSGTVIGASGATGVSFGPHLHFSIRINPFNRADGWGGYSDPLPYFDPALVILPAYVTDTSRLQITYTPQVSVGKSALTTWPGYTPDQAGVNRP